MASNATIPNTNSPVQQVQLLDAAGLALGSSASPLMTGTSALQTTADLTKSIIAPIVTATTTTLIAAAASVRGRAYRVRIDVAGANVLTITDATGAEKMNFVGAGFKVLDFATRPWYVTAVNTALTITTTTTAEVNVTVEWTRVA